MSSKVPKLVKKTAKAHKKLARKLTLPDTKYYLLQVNGQTNDFVLLEDLKNTFHKFNEYRQTMKFEIATLDTQLIQKILKADSIAIGQNPYYIYEIDSRDKIAPDAERPFWTLYGTKTGEIYSPKLAITLTPSSLTPLVGQAIDINWVSTLARPITDYLSYYPVNNANNKTLIGNISAGLSGSFNFAFMALSGQFRIGYFNSNNIELASSSIITITP